MGFINTRVSCPEKASRKLRVLCVPIPPTPISRDKFLTRMGGVFGALGWLPYEHWMPDEDPTFYIPASPPLTFEQQLILQEFGFQQGEPFVLTCDGRVTKPESKKLALRGLYSCISIQKGSMALFEVEQGKFSLEFSYFTPVPVSIVVHIFAKDTSDEKDIKFERTLVKWGPFPLDATTSTTSPPQPQASNRNGTEIEEYKVDEELYGFKKSTLSAIGVGGNSSNKNNTVQHNVPAPAVSNTKATAYAKWSSRRYNLQPSNAPALIEATQLASAVNNGAVFASVYDVVLIVTPTLPKNSTAPPQSLQRPTAPATAASNATSLTTQANEVRRGSRTYHKVLPTALDGAAAGSAENKHTAQSGDQVGLYQVVTTTSDDHDGESAHRRTQHVQKVAVRGDNRAETAAAATASSTSGAAHSAVQLDSTCFVRKEAFFYRLNYEAYTKRHDVTSGGGGSGSGSSNDAHRKTSVHSEKETKKAAKSARKASIQEDKSALNTATAPPMAGVFMRSKAVPLECAMQLFQVESGVYNRVTLYGMEGFAFPDSDSQELTAMPAPPVSTAAGRDERRPLSPTNSTDTRGVATIGAAERAMHTSSAREAAECIICMSSKQTTIMFPCRHLCLCNDCAQMLASRNDTNAPHHHAGAPQEKKCPVCRKPVVVMFQLKVA